MTVARLHTKLFEAAALDLDRKIRARFVDENLRPEYLGDSGSPLHDMARFMEAGVEVGGRLRWLKRFLRRLLRPYSHYQGCLNQMMVRRLEEQHQGLAHLTVACEELRQDLDHQAECLHAEMSAMVEEFRRWRPAVAASQPAGAATRPVAAGAKLILGTVTIKRPGYLHIDALAAESVDLLAPLDQLPVEPGSAAEIIVANALERFPAQEVRGRLLPYWASLLRPGGRLTVIADDFGAAGDRFRDGQIDFTDLTELLFGDGDRARRSAYTPELLRQFVTETGLTDVSVIDRRQRPEACAYGFELTASRPAS